MGVGDTGSDPAKYYAHSLPTRPCSEWHPLQEHLETTAKLAESFAAEFDVGPLGRLAGLWHDFGKYQKTFQARLFGSNEHVDHAVIGALLAKSRMGEETFLPLAMSIAGHHGGLPDVQSLRERMEKYKKLLASIMPSVPASIRDCPLATLPGDLLVRPANRAQQETLRLRAEFLTRFLYSALVDADFLDTESFFEPNKRAGAVFPSTIEKLRAKLDSYVDGIQEQARPSEVNSVRSEVLGRCREAANLSPGIFTLTVPTGAGKTLSGMSFALRHAEQYGLRRVIVVIPYTSIIEQNAEVYRAALGEDGILEHHSAIDPRDESDRDRLASENWDAPVVVTTTVQFFESLFACSSSRCRKLHNIARSVIILDEVQCLPPGLLQPIVDGLNSLVTHYVCSIVLSTATPPALTAREGTTWGLRGTRPIMGDIRSLSRRLERVHVVWPGVEERQVSWETLANRAVQFERCMVVVNRREDARILARLMPPEGRFHLSALMCPAHRLETLAQIRLVLDGNGPCRVVSTQLVEAGVDLDFPVVFRAMTGLDSIVQAAGRCNREGKLKFGEVFVFHPPTPQPRGVLARAGEQTMSLLAEYNNHLDLTDPAIFEKYFRALYHRSDTDAKGVQPERASLNFTKVASKFQMIEEGQMTPLVVPWGDSENMLNAVRSNGVSRDYLRALQRFVVSIYLPEFEKLQQAMAIEEIHETVHALTLPFRYLYSSDYGIVIEGDIKSDVGKFVV